MHKAAWIAQQRGRKAVLYVVRVWNEAEAFYKIGITFDLSARFARLKTSYKWRTLAKYSVYNAAQVWDLEQRLHGQFAHLSYSPKADFNGKTECYAVAEEILAALPESTFYLRPVGDIL